MDFGLNLVIQTLHRIIEQKGVLFINENTLKIVRKNIVGTSCYVPIMMLCPIIYHQNISLYIYSITNSKLISVTYIYKSIPFHMPLTQSCQNCSACIVASILSVQLVYLITH